MRIGIITFHNGSNYGAALQTFALQEAMKAFDADIEIINYKNEFIMKGLKIIRVEPSLHGIYYFLLDLFQYRANKNKIQKFKQFFKYYNLTRLLSSEELKKEDLMYDLVVSGSDQIWNPLLNKGYDDIYFADIFNVKRKVSYGSSIGNYKLDDLKLNKELTDLLAGFTQISVRERANEIGRVVNRKVVEVCDPTILLTKEQWKTNLNLKQSTEKFLLIYCLTDSDNVIKYARKIAINKNLKIYYIGRTLVKRRGVVYYDNIGPKEFVELFFNASYIVTNSFHGTAFSVNFSKQFVSLKHPKSPERAMAFLKRIGLEGRLISDNSIIDDMSEQELWDGLNKLKTIRAHGIQYIESCMRGE